MYAKILFKGGRGAPPYPPHEKKSPFGDFSLDFWILTFEIFDVFETEAKEVWILLFWSESLDGVKLFIRCWTTVNKIVDTRIFMRNRRNVKLSSGLVLHDSGLYPLIPRRLSSRSFTLFIQPLGVALWSGHLNNHPMVPRNAPNQWVVSLVHLVFAAQLNSGDLTNADIVNLHDPERLRHECILCNAFLCFFLFKKGLTTWFFYGWGVGGLPPTPLTKKNPFRGFFA